MQSICTRRFSIVEHRDNISHFISVWAFTHWVLGWHLFNFVNCMLSLYWQFIEQCTKVALPFGKKVLLLCDYYTKEIKLTCFAMSSLFSMLFSFNIIYIYIYIVIHRQICFILSKLISVARQYIYIYIYIFICYRLMLWFLIQNFFHLQDYLLY